MNEDLHAIVLLFVEYRRCIKLTITLCLFTVIFGTDICVFTQIYECAGVNNKMDVQSVRYAAFTHIGFDMFFTVNAMENHYMNVFGITSKHISLLQSV